MNQKHLTQIWQWLSVLGLLFLLSSMISIQGGADFLGKLFGDMAKSSVDNKPAVGYFGSIIGSGLFFIGACALSLHAKRHGDSWHERIPVLWLDGLNTSSWEGKLFQIIMLIVLLAVPAAGISRCILEAEQGDICETETERVYDGERTTLIWPPAAENLGHQMRLRSGYAGTSGCVDGIEIFPRMGTPLLIYGLPAAGAFVGLMALTLIFRKRS